MAASWPSPSFGGGNLFDRMPQNTEVSEESPITVSHKFESGPAQTRVIASARFETATFTQFVKTDAVVNELFAFHDNTLNQGADYFIWEMPYAHGTSRLMQFVSRPSSVWFEADLWQVFIQLRVKPL